MKASRAHLREMMARDRPVVAPFVYDGLTARLAEAAGFEAVYMTGFGTAAARGFPDLGLLTLSEMACNVRTLVRAVEVPVVCDADTGYGNPINVWRTVREYEEAGAAALHIEDQVWPKRCGFMAGKQVVPIETMLAKVRAAVDARRDPALVIIARTDALAPHGWVEANAVPEPTAPQAPTSSLLTASSRARISNTTSARWETCRCCTTASCCRCPNAGLPAQADNPHRNAICRLRSLRATLSRN